MSFKKKEGVGVGGSQTGVSNTPNNKKKKSAGLRIVQYTCHIIHVEETGMLSLAVLSWDSQVLSSNTDIAEFLK